MDVIIISGDTLEQSLQRIVVSFFLPNKHYTKIVTK